MANDQHHWPVLLVLDMVNAELKIHPNDLMGLVDVVGSWCQQRPHHTHSQDLVMYAANVEECNIVHLSMQVMEVVVRVKNAQVTRGWVMTDPAASILCSNPLD